MGARNSLLRAGIQRRQRRAPEARFSDRLQIGKWRSSNGGETDIEQIRRRCILVNRRSRDG